MKRLSVVSNRMQLELLMKRFDFDQGDELLCDNASFASELSKEKIQFQLVDEFMIRDHWDAINTWGISQATEWMDLCVKHRLLKKYNLATQMKLFLGHNAIQLLKNYQLACWIISHYSPSEIILFEGFARRPYPSFTGNSMLNHFLHQKAKLDQCRIEVIDLRLRGSLDDSRSIVAQTHHSSLAVKIKKGISKLHSMLFKPPQNIQSLVYGSLRHLGGTIEAMKEKGMTLGILGAHWNWSQFSFAIKNRIPYFVHGSWERLGELKSGQLCREFNSQFDQAIQLLMNSQLFRYQGFDLKSSYVSEVLCSMSDYFVAIANKMVIYDSLWKICQPANLLVDEDHADWGGPLAAHMSFKGVKVYCLSHAHLAVDFSVQKDFSTFANSTTIVHSEYERESYVARGWDSNQIEVLGIPRFDSLTVNSKVVQAQKSDNASKLKLLYCAAEILDHNPNCYGYLGLQIAIFESVQSAALKRILKAIQDLPIELVIKPHTIEYAPKWRQWLEHNGVSSSVKLVDQNCGISSLFSQHDAMVLSYWSTALIEAAIFGLPVIFADFAHCHGQSLNQISNANVCDIARSDNQLKLALESLVAKKRNGALIRKDRSRLAEHQYYLGRNDGKGLERVAEYIMKSEVPASMEKSLC